MDDRQSNIEVGAGLQDERINQDFVDFLEKWSLPVLVVLLIVVGLYSGSKYYGTWQDTKNDDAFVDLEAARGAMGDDGVRLASPDSLLAVAKEHAGRGGVSLLAQLEAADIYLGAIRRGFAPGANLQDIQPDEMLDADMTAVLLTNAGDLYQTVADRTVKNSSRTALYVRAMFGSASVAISRNEIETARELFVALAERADAMGYTAHATEARNRIDLLASYYEEETLYREYQINSFENDPFTTRLDEEHLLLQQIPADEVPEAAIQAELERQRNKQIQDAERERINQAASEGDQPQTTTPDDQPADEEPSDPSDQG